MGKLFHSLGAALQSALAPKCFFVVASLVDTGEAETRLGGGQQMKHWKVGGTSSGMYWGAVPFMQLYTRGRILKSIRRMYILTLTLPPPPPKFHSVCVRACVRACVCVCVCLCVCLCARTLCFLL